MALSSEEGDEGELSLQEIVFSCGICQATVSEVYATKESNQGFHSGSGDEDGIVTKLWIAECSHITCGKHLEGGAAPFHPKDMQPSAPCPQCMEAGDDSLKELYGIRGLSEGQYDSNIPASWIHCPPIKLDGYVPGMEAVRFQYMNVARYARRITGHWKTAQRNLQAVEAAYSNERKQRRQVQAEVLELRARVVELEISEVRLKKWEARKPRINHYLAVFGEMAREIESMRSELSQLGYHVPERNYTFEPDKDPATKDAASVRRDADQHPGKSFSSSSTAVAAGQDNSSSSRKRKLAEYGADVVHSTGREARRRRSSRDLMPPPLPKFKAPQREAQLHIEPEASHPLRRPLASRQTMNVFEDQSRRSQHFDTQRSKHSSSEREAMPFRRSHGDEPGISNDSQAYSVYHDAGNERRRGPTATHHNIIHPVQPLAQLSLGSPERQQALLYGPPGARSMIPQARQQISRQSRPRITEYDADCGTVAQQRNDQARQPLQPFSGSHLNSRIVTPPHAQDMHATLSAQSQSQAPAASVLSPFFKRGAASQPTTTQRPPPRGKYVQPQYASLSRESARDYSRPPSSNERLHGYSQRPSRNGSALIERPHRAVDHQPLYQSPSAPMVADGRYSRASMIPQIPRNSQGLFQRPDQSRMSVAHAPSRSQPIADRGRITLPPNQQPTSFVASQEQALSQIRGVRGLVSQGTRPLSKYASGPLYDPVRTLYSSAGGRRSIRR